MFYRKKYADLLKPDNIDIQLDNNVLTISGQRREEKEEKGQTFHRLERRHSGRSHVW